MFGLAFGFKYVAATSYVVQIIFSSDHKAKAKVRLTVGACPYAPRMHCNLCPRWSLAETAACSRLHLDDSSLPHPYRPTAKLARGKRANSATCVSPGRALQAPIGITRLFKHPLYDWNLNTNADEYLARGKVLGGSSSTNATLYHRGTAADYDDWQLPGWGANDVLPWFKCAEDNPAFQGSKWHSTGARRLRPRCVRLWRSE